MGFFGPANFQAQVGLEVLVDDGKDRNGILLPVSAGESCLDGEAESGSKDLMTGVENSMNTKNKACPVPTSTTRATSRISLLRCYPEHNCCFTPGSGS